MAELIIRPNGAGNKQEWDAEGGDYTRVDEETSDGDTTRLYTPTANRVATFAMANHSSESGTINSVTVYINTRGLDAVSNVVQLAVRIGSTDYFSADKTYNNTSYHTESNSWATNPNTSAAWTWTNVDDLEAGMKRISGGGQAVTQVWAVVDYTDGPVAPTVTTQAVSSIDKTTATGNGNVTADGGATVTERGVCWKTSTGPTTADSKATATGTTGAFTASMTSLAKNTKYYVRAYAINSAGTSYGAEVEFTTLPGEPLIEALSGTDAGFARTADTDPFTSGGEVTYTVQNADELSADTYYWRVRVKDPTGSDTWSSWSATRSFTVSAAIAYTLTAQNSAYTLTGKDNALKVARKLLTEKSAYTFTAKDVILKKALKLTTQKTDFNITAKNVLLKVGHTITTSATAYTITAKNALFPIARKIVASATGYTITAQNAILKKALKLTTQATAYTLTGIDVALRYVQGATNYVLTAEVTNYVVTGKNILTPTARKIIASVSGFTITAKNVALKIALRLVAQKAGYTLTTKDADLTLVEGFKSYVLTAQKTAFVVSAKDSLLKIGKKLTASVTAYALTTKETTVQKELTLTTETTAYNVTSLPANLVKRGQAGLTFFGISL